MSKECIQESKNLINKYHKDSDNYTYYKESENRMRVETSELDKLILIRELLVANKYRVTDIKLTPTACYLYIEY